VKNAPGLRSQFLVGLILIIIVSTFCVGFLTIWAAKSKSLAGQIENGRFLGQALARLASQNSLRGELEPERLRSWAGDMSDSPVISSLEIFDRKKNILASRRKGALSRGDDGDVDGCLRTEQQRASLIDEDPPLVSVSTPLFVQGKFKGALRLRLPLMTELFNWPFIFWVLMAINGLILILFVERVVSHYVIRPVQALQRAAAQVARGDLSVQLVEQGAFEISSLAKSFNIMTSSVREQMHRLEKQQEELAASREHLIRSEKLAPVGRLAAGVAHEVGNPLQSIIGFTEILLGPSSSAEEQRAFLERIRNEAQRIHHTIRELLDYARPVQDDIEAIDLALIADQSIQLVQHQKRFKSVEVVSRSLENLRPAAANGHRLVQVLVNILLNAADAMKGEGTIVVEGVLLDKERLVGLKISNTGPLIPPEHRGRIFDPFFTTKDPGEGTGLGLSVAQSIVESYGGTLSLDDGGPPTAFTIMLQLWSDEAR
jgi:signal transduction histidine kinase